MHTPAPDGVPAHDTFSRVLTALKPEELYGGFSAWFAAIQYATKGELVAVDGKTVRHSASRMRNGTALQLVSA